MKRRLEVACHSVRVPAQSFRCLLQLVLASTVRTIVLRQVAHVRDIHDLVHRIPSILEVPSQGVGEQERAKVANVRGRVNGRAAMIERHPLRLKRFERNLFARARIVQTEGHGAFYLPPQKLSLGGWCFSPMGTHATRLQWSMLHWRSEEHTSELQ